MGVAVDYKRNEVKVKRLNENFLFSQKAIIVGQGKVTNAKILVMRSWSGVQPIVCSKALSPQSVNQMVQLTSLTAFSSLIAFRQSCIIETYMYYRK